MQNNSYPKFVRKSNIEKILNFKEERVFKLSIPISKSGKTTILVISRAPKPCGDQGCSKSIHRVLKYIKSKKEELKNIYRVTCVYLFPVLEYEKTTLETVLEEKGESFLTGEDGVEIDGKLLKNDDIIEEAINEADYIIFAWGEPTKSLWGIYNNRIEYLLKTFKNCKINSNTIKKAYVVGDLTRNGYARHCLSWNESDQLNEYEV